MNENIFRDEAYRDIAARAAVAQTEMAGEKILKDVE